VYQRSWLINMKLASGLSVFESDLAN